MKAQDMIDAVLAQLEGFDAMPLEDRGLVVESMAAFVAEMGARLLAESQALTAPTLKLTKTQESALARMGETPGHINPFDYGASTISTFKKQGVIEPYRLAKDGRGIALNAREGSVRYRLTTKGIEAAQMARAS